ncbi:MAG: hypothetical protein JWP52_4120, partial [Rhizobacter sp.]|nr:hypothetical protein [Rhizobacter sp.]
MKLSIFHFIRHLACPVRRVVWGALPVGALFAAAVLLCASPSSTAAGDGLHHFSVEVLAQPLLAITGDRFTITGYPEKKGWNLASPAGPVKFDLYPSLEDEMDFKDPLNSKSYFFLHIADAVRQVDHRLVFALTEIPCNLVTL